MRELEDSPGRQKLALAHGFSSSSLMEKTRE
jgi:hypothetical protein